MTSKDLSELDKQEALIDYKIKEHEDDLKRFQFQYTNNSHNHLHDNRVVDFTKETPIRRRTIPVRPRRGVKTSALSKAQLALSNKKKTESLYLNNEDINSSQELELNDPILSKKIIKKTVEKHNKKKKTFNIKKR